MNRVLIPPMERAPRRPSGPVAVLSGASMGTTWSVRAVLERPDVSSADAERAVRAELDRVVAQMSPWEPTSFVSRFNRAPAGSWHAPPTEAAEVLERALAVAAWTGGAFDPALGVLTDLWGFGSAPFAGAPPGDAAVAAASAAAGWRRLRWEGGRLLQPGGLALDLCGIAKGYAVDRVVLALGGLGLGACLVEVGGELRGAGVKPDGQPWWVALESPPGAQGLPRSLVALADLAVATSGGYRRFFNHGGRRFAHTLDPAQGRPTDGAVACASVLDADCIVADALATALIAMGFDQACAFSRQAGLAVRLVGAGAQEWLSPGFLGMMAETDPAGRPT